MLASPIHYQKRPARSVSVTSPLLRHLNMGTLALVLFVALALLNTSRGNELETRKFAHARDTEPELAIGACDTSLAARQEIQGHKFTTKDFGNKRAPDR